MRGGRGKEFSMRCRLAFAFLRSRSLLEIELEIKYIHIDGTYCLLYCDYVDEVRVVVMILYEYLGYFRMR